VSLNTYEPESGPMVQSDRGNWVSVHGLPHWRMVADDGTPPVICRCLLRIANVGRIIGIAHEGKEWRTHDGTYPVSPRDQWIPLREIDQLPGGRATGGEG
jgi:hypothetical protein